jgi:hypothetical protein
MLPHESSSAQPEDRRCPICFDDLCADGGVKVLASCSHAFCEGCIDAWLDLSASCPLCRTACGPRPMTDFELELPLGICLIQSKNRGRLCSSPRRAAPGVLRIEAFRMLLIIGGRVVLTVHCSDVSSLSACRVWGRELTISYVKRKTRTHRRQTSHALTWSLETPGDPPDDGLGAGPWRAQQPASGHT